MNKDILSGTVCSYHNRGSPVVKSDGKITIIGGYTTAHKTPIGDIAEYVLTDIRKTFDIAKIVNEVPSDTIGTVSAISRTGQTLMDCCGKKILLSGYLVPPQIGTDIHYRTIFSRTNFDVAWVVDKNDAFGKTLEFIAHRSTILDFASSREKDFFLNTLKDIGQHYSRGYPQCSLMSLEDLYFTMDKRLIGKNEYDTYRFDVLNGLKFIKQMIAENYSIRA